MAESLQQKAVLVRAGTRLCALRIESMVETMRPLPVSPISGAPPFVSGIAIVRGEPLPVVDLAAFLDPGAVPPPPARFAVIRAGSRRAALAVSAVLGVVDLDSAGDRAMPLVADACAGALEALRARDDDLLLVLGTARIVPEEAYAVLESWEADA